MNEDRLRLLFRLVGALVLASSGLSLGYMLVHVKEIGLLWALPMSASLAASITAGFFLIWLNRIDRYHD